MSLFRLIPSLGVALLPLTIACGGGDDTPEPPATVAEAMEQASQAMTDAASGGTEPISAEALQARLPEELNGFARGETERQDVGAMGFQMSMARATYSDGDKRVEVSLTDTGNVGAMAPMAASWAMMDFDRTSSSGYERTMRFEGYKGYEEMSTSGGRLRSKLSLLVADRIVVNLEGNNVEVDDLKEMASDLDLRSLARAN